MSTQTATIITQTNQDYTWSTYFNPLSARAAVLAYCDTLPSAARPIKHTRAIYTTGLDNFIEYLGGLARPVRPDKTLLLHYIADLKSGTASPSGQPLKSSTIASKYLAPVRHWLTALSDQYIESTSGGEYLYISDTREALRQAARVKNPAAETSTNLSPLYAHGNRLTAFEVSKVLDAINIEALSGKRDLALLYVGFTTGLRVAELARVTLASIQPDTSGPTIRVIGKRGNTDPVPFDDTGAALITAWVEAFNNGLEPDDPRIISQDTPVFQPLIHGDNYPVLGVNSYKPTRGMSAQAIRKIVERRVYTVLGRKISPHDMRRTVAAIARQAGMDYDQIRLALRHKNIATTARYVGNPPDLSKSRVTNYVTLYERKA